MSERQLGEIPVGEPLFWTTIAHIDPDTHERKWGPPDERGGITIEAPRPADWTLERELAGEWAPGGESCR